MKLIKSGLKRDMVVANDESADADEAQKVLKKRMFAESASTDITAARGKGNKWAAVRSTEQQKVADKVDKDKAAKFKN